MSGRLDTEGSRVSGRLGTVGSGVVSGRLDTEGSRVSGRLDIDGSRVSGRLDTEGGGTCPGVWTRAVWVTVLRQGGVGVPPTVAHGR